MGSSGELAEVSVTHASWNGSGSGQQPSPAHKLATIREIITRHVHYNTLLRRKDNVGSAFVVCELFELRVRQVKSCGGAKFCQGRSSELLCAGLHFV